MEPEPKEWGLSVDHASKTKFGKFNSKHPREYDSLFANLDKIIQLLDSGNRVGGFNVGFFRSEGGGVYRIGQTGVPRAKESRLYVYPDEDAKIMYVINVGSKEDQQSDINDAKGIVKTIKQLISSKK
jgi:hypothetical protein